MNPRAGPTVWGLHVRLVTIFLEPPRIARAGNHFRWPDTRGVMETKHTKFVCINSGMMVCLAIILATAYSSQLSEGSRFGGCFLVRVLVYLRSQQSKQQPPPACLREYATRINKGDCYISSLIRGYVVGQAYDLQTHPLRILSSLSGVCRLRRGVLSAELPWASKSQSGGTPDAKSTLTEKFPLCSATLRLYFCKGESFGIHY